MSQTAVRLPGMKAMLAVIALIGLVGFRWASVVETLPNDGREVLERWIQLEFQIEFLDDEAPNERQGAIDKTRAVKIEALSAHGRPDDFVVRVRLQPNAAIPRGTKLTRYYSLQHSEGVGWQAPGRATAMDYYLRFF